jgi:hypothetical protein
MISPNSYLTSQNTLKKQTFIPPAEFELLIPASELPKTHALDRAAIGIGQRKSTLGIIIILSSSSSSSSSSFISNKFNLYPLMMKRICVVYKDPVRTAL